MILVDTTVIIDIARKVEASKEAIEVHAGDQFAISAITLEEIYAGLGHTLERKGKDFFLRVKEGYEKILSQYTILEVTDRILKKAGMFRGFCSAKGLIIDQADAIINVTAEINKIEVIISRNPDHFKLSQVKIHAYKKA